MKKQEAKIEKCPFCGGFPEIQESESDWTLYSVRCSECHTEQPGHLSKDTAIDRWNQRV